MENEKKIYLVPYAHLDTQWRWEYPTTIKKYIKNTIDENLAMLEKYPEYCFNFTGAIRYELMKEYYPEGYARVREYIKQGRWHLAGTCLEETDTIVPSVESMIRNVLYGDLWQMREFGVSSKDYMLPDCFGFPENMPTVLKHCGINGFSTQKLTWGCAVGIPFNIGKWIGPDKSELLCAFDPCPYVDCLDRPVQQIKERVDKLNAQGEASGVYKTMQYYGVGDMGGAPKEPSIVNAIESVGQSSLTGVSVQQTSPTIFFDSFDEGEKSLLKEYKGDLLLTQHSAGSITSQAIMKRWNRQNEQLAFVGEYFALLAEKVAGLKYPKERIFKAWKKVIGSQMHDILPGTCTPTAYEYSYNDEILALKDWNKIIDESIKALLPCTLGDGNILVVNPYECERHLVCEFVYYGLNKEKKYILSDGLGNSYNAQIKQLDNEKFLVVAEVFAKAFELKRFSIKEGENASGKLKLVQTEKSFQLENEFLKISISRAGEIYSLIDKTSGREMFKKPLSYHLQSEFPLEFPAWNMDWKDRKLPPKKVISTGEVSVSEDGMARKTLKIVTKLNKSLLIKEISLTNHSKEVCFTERINWREKGVSLKLALSADIENPACIYNWETSVIERPKNHEKQYEVPSRYYADIKNEKGGIAILENCKYGYDRPSDDTLRLTLLYTPKVRLNKGFLDQGHQDFGMHTIKYALYPHGAENDVDLEAKAFNRPPRLYKVAFQKSTLKDLGLFKIDTNKFGLLAVKKAESQEGYIIRIYNRKKIEEEVGIKFLKPLTNVYLVNGKEEIVSELNCSEGIYKTHLGATAILSILVKTPIDRLEITEQKSLKLSRNEKLLSLPKQMLGRSISSGNIDFDLGDEKALYVITCNGQKIKLNGGFNMVSLLVCADKKVKSKLTFLDSNNVEVECCEIVVYPMLGFVGQYDKRKWLFKEKHAKKYQRNYAWLNKFVGIKKGWVRETKIACYTTHTILGQEDLYYQHGYIEQIDIKVSDKVKQVILPIEADIKVLAMTQSNQISDLENVTLKSDCYEI